MVLGMLNRFKVVKDLLLTKLDNLEEINRSMVDRLDRLDHFVKSQLENEESLMQASIHTIETLQKQHDLLTHQTSLIQSHASSSERVSVSAAITESSELEHGQSTLPFAGRSLILLGSQEEISCFKSSLSNEGYEPLGIEWDWTTDITLNHFSEELPILVCKFPLSQKHWEIIQKLKEQRPNNLFVLSMMQPV